jgi:hypothetical protein
VKHMVRQVALRLAIVPLFMALWTLAVPVPASHAPVVNPMTIAEAR